MNIKAIIKELEKRKKAIGIERDKIRELISDTEALEEVCQRAYESIESAIDDLSELT